MESEGCALCSSEERHLSKVSLLLLSGESPNELTVSLDETQIEIKRLV